MSDNQHEATLINAASQAAKASQKAFDELNAELEEHLGTNRYVFTMDFCNTFVIEDNYTQAELPWNYQRFPKSLKELEKLFRQARQVEEDE